jgi:FkbM family methyltransferase
VRRLPDITDAPSAWQALNRLAVSRRGALAFDVGANIGQASRLLAPYFDRVVAFEPADESFAVLVTEHPDNVIPLPLAVSDGPPMVVLDVADQAIETGQLVSRAGCDGHPEWGRVVTTREVPATTIDHWAGRLGQLPALVKVDTEGHEPGVLDGAEHTIGLRFTSWFIEVHAGWHEDLLMNAFDPEFYEMTRVDHDYLANGRGGDHFYLMAVPTWLV